MALKLVCRSNLKLLKIPHLGLLTPSFQNNVNAEFTRHVNKHWNPKWKRLRREKVQRVEFPNFNDKKELTPEEQRTKMKEKGIKPARFWMERPFYISCTGGMFEAYVPPEGDGKKSIITPTGAKQSLQFLEKKSKSMMAIRKVKSFEEDFEVADFCERAQDIYTRAHQYMAEKDTEKLQDVVTERAYPEMIHNVKFKTVHWKFIKSLEPPRVVHARSTDVISKENVFGQITVRFHTQQQLAIYDRFGRLMYGSEILAKDVLEYVVFEKHLANLYGVWRLHDKIIPDWMPPREPMARTYVTEDLEFDVGFSADRQKEEDEKSGTEITGKDAPLEKAVVS